MNDQKTTLEIIAPTVDEAVERGLDQLGLPRDAVSVEVLDEGQGGFLGIGARQVRVRLTLNDHQPETVVTEKVETEVPLPEEFEDELEEAKERAGRIVKELLKTMQVSASVSARVLEPEDDKDDPMVLVEVTKRSSILIGRRAETLILFSMSSLILNQHLGKWMPLMIDVQGYRFCRERQLRQLARRPADRGCDWP